jgi:hypothetical protein
MLRSIEPVWGRNEVWRLATKARCGLFYRVRPWMCLASKGS